MHKCAVCPEQIEDKQTTCSNKCRQKLHRQKQKAVTKKFVPEKMKCTQCGKKTAMSELRWCADRYPDEWVCIKCLKADRLKWQGTGRPIKLPEDSNAFKRRTIHKNMGNAGVRPRAGRPKG